MTGAGRSFCRYNEGEERWDETKETVDRDCRNCSIYLRRNCDTFGKSGPGSISRLIHRGSG